MNSVNFFCKVLKMMLTEFLLRLTFIKQKYFFLIISFVYKSNFVTKINVFINRTKYVYFHTILLITEVYEVFFCLRIISF